MGKTYFRGITLILIFMGLSLSCAYAKKRNSEEAWAIAVEKMSEVGIVAEMPQLAVKRSAMKASGGIYSPYYVFNSDNNNGYVIVSGDDCLPDIVGYGTDGNFDEDDMPAGLAFLLEVYTSFVEDIETGEEEALARARQLKARRLTSNDNEGIVVDPLLGDIQWGQGSPFNNYCPSISGEKCVTGCVPVAMAQIMAYHKWPSSLNTEIPGYTYTDTYNGETYTQTISEISEGAVYDWENMLSSYDGTYTDDEAEAVAKLVYHCAVAAQVDFNPSASTGHPTISMFSDYFDYDADLGQTLYASYFTLSEWSHIIKNELANGRPIMYRGERSTSSHRFVIDGLDSEGLSHINWGWNGLYNGYFDITILNPYGDNDGYNRDNSMYVGITPDNGIQDSRLYETYIAAIYCRNIEITEDSRSDNSEEFSGSADCFIRNYTDEDFAGFVGLCIVDVDGILENIGEATSVSLRAMTSEGTYGKAVTLSFSYAFPTGTYAIIPAYTDDGGVTWKACGRAENCGFIVQATEDSLSIGDRTVSVTIEAEDELLTGLDNQLKLTATNELGLEFRDCLYIYGDTTEMRPSTCTEEVFLWIPSGESKSTYIDIEVGNADYYYVWVEDSCGNKLVDGQAFPVTYNPDPVLTITGVTTNASTTDYETENAYLYDDKVKVPIIYDDKFILTSTIENTGGLYRGNFYVKKRTLNSSGTYTRTTIRTTYRTIPANSTVTFCDTVYSYEFDDQLANVDIMKVSDGVELNEISKALQIYKVDTSGYYNLDSNRAIGYFYESSGINSVEADTFSIRVIGCNIILTSDRRQTVMIYSLSGQLMKVVDLGADETVNISLYPGIYIVNGMKILLQ